MNRGRYKNPEKRLTSRHLSIIALILRAYGHKEIAARLGISANVVKNYCRVIYELTGAANKVELVVMYGGDSEMQLKSSTALLEWDKRRNG
jgi:DNA-binding NarL/FixJ family response regulator